MSLRIRESDDQDLGWLLDSSAEIGGPLMLAGGMVYDLGDYPALIAQQGEQPVGFVTYRLGNERCYILAIKSDAPGQGVGSALLSELETRARGAGKRAVRISATNDNLPALRFLQLRGYRMRQMISGGFTEAKKLKGYGADEKVIGVDGIEISDEIVLNKDL